MPQGYPFTREDADRIMDRLTRLFYKNECPHFHLCGSVEQCLKKDINKLGLSYALGPLPDTDWRIRDGVLAGVAVVRV